MKNKFTEKMINTIKYIKQINSEVFMVIGLNFDNSVMFVEPVAAGNEDEVHLCFNDLRFFLDEHGCKKFVCIHNHPGEYNIVEPSKPDDKLTKSFKWISKTLGYNMLDHIIVGEENGYFSYNEHNWVYDANNTPVCELK